MNESILPWVEFRNNIGENFFDPGEVAVLQSVQLFINWGPLEWKKASSFLLAEKDPFRKKGRKYNPKEGTNTMLILFG